MASRNHIGRTDMDHADVLPLFRCMAVLAQVVCSLAHLPLSFDRYLTTTGHRLCYPLLLRLEKVANDAVQETQVVINLLIPIELFHLLRHQPGLSLFAQQHFNPILNGSGRAEDRYPFL